MTEKNIADELKALIGLNGPDYLYREPYSVYTKLAEAPEADVKLIGGLLFALINGICRYGNICESPEAISELIQKECCFNKRMADRLSKIFCMLYSKENTDAWNARKLSGWLQFKKSDLLCNWSGFAIWCVNGGSVSCIYKAEIVLKPTKTIQADEKLTRLLEGNPFLTAEAITKYYKDSLCDNLNGEFEYYCTCDDYYPPVVEDFNVDYYVGEWCNENGFKLVSCDGDGYDEGFEPSF